MAATEQGRARVVYRPSDQRSAWPAAGLGRFGVLALVALVFSGGLVIGRWTGRPAAEPASPATQATAAAPAAPGAASATPAQPRTAAGTSAASPGTLAKAGPSRLVDGIGVGYAHSRPGAVAAATVYASAFSGDLLFDTARRRRAVAAIAAPEAVASLQRSMDEAVPLVRKGLRLPADGPVASRVILRTTPFGWAVDRYDDKTAQVSVWTTGIVGSVTGIAVQQVWATTTIDLKWVGGDWKELGVTSRDAPTPLAPDTGVPSPADAFLQQTQRFKEYYDDAPGS